MSHHYEGPKDKTNPLYYVPVAIIAVGIVVTVFVSGLMRGQYAGQMKDKKASADTGRKQVDVRALAQPTEELVTKGRQLFSINCVSCHGAEGRGDGPKGADLNPLPRNFHTPASEWTNGPSVTGMWKTLDKGVPGTSMSAYILLPGDERIALIHYIRESFIEGAPEITPEDIAALPGPSSASGDTTVLDAAAAPLGPTIPVELAMEQLVRGHNARPAIVRVSSDVQLSSMGGEIYGTHCASCHGATGGGSSAARVLTAHPNFRLAIGPFANSRSTWVADRDAFGDIVTDARPGRTVHGFSTLNEEELDQLHQYVAALSQEGVIAE